MNGPTCPEHPAGCVQGAAVAHGWPAFWRTIADAARAWDREERDAMSHTTRRIHALQHAARELERLARVLREEELSGAAEHVDDALFSLGLRIETLAAGLEGQTPEQRLRDLLG